MPVLVIEDDDAISQFIHQGLNEAGYVVDVARDGRQGVDCAIAAEYDAIVLDVLLPKLDGLSVLKELRQQGLQTPVLLLTACDTVQDRVLGLDAGADDYLVKPFDFTELLARLRALLRLEQHHLKLNLEPIDFRDLLAAIAEQIQPLAELHQLQFSTQIAPDLQVQGSPDHLIRLFLNLLDNAIKYTAHGGCREGQVEHRGQVKLTATGGDRTIQVTVSDTGIGIAPEHAAHLFERFYRVDKARDRAIGGTGLGLAIAQEIVHRHRGAIAVQSELGQGTSFTVTLPKQT